MKWPVKIRLFKVIDLELHLHKITGQFYWPKNNWHKRAARNRGQQSRPQMSFKKIFCIQTLENKCKVVDLLVQKLSNHMILD